MKIRITRADPMAGFPDPNNHKPGVLSVEDFDGWDEALKHLREDRGIRISEASEAEMRAHADSQFTWQELITDIPGCAFVGGVMYDVRVVEA